ncbi:hypothetical protein ACTMU2_19155 [Cupriavidus basilensis]
MQCSIGFFNDVPMAVLFITVGLGYAIGKLHIGPIALGGVCGTLIVALLVGQTGCQLHGELKDVAFALFIFAMGYSGGPQFFANLNRSSLRFMLLPLIEAFVVLAIVLDGPRGCFILMPEIAAGLAAGAATESAVVGTAAEALRPSGPRSCRGDAHGVEHCHGLYADLSGGAGQHRVLHQPGRAAAAAIQPAGEASKALATKLEAASEDDVATQPALPRVVGRAYRVEHTAGLTVRELEAGLGGRTQMIGLFRDNAPVDVQPDLRMEHGDITALIGVRERLVHAGERIGAEVLVPGGYSDVLQLGEHRVIINKTGINGRTLGELGRAAMQRHSALCLDPADRALGPEPADHAGHAPAERRPRYAGRRGAGAGRRRHRSWARMCARPM